jgi:methylene-tetrahydromethanopterin dehydrogenase
MMEQLKATLLKPFEISSFADPAGSFTTAAAMVACVEKILKKKKGRAFAKTKILIFGATGVVGYSSAVIAALEGADVTLAGHDGLERVQAKADDIKKRFGVDVHAVDTSTPVQLLEVLVRAEIVFCAAAAGVRVLSASALASAKSLIIAADVNAVPPAGIEGLQLMDNGVELPGGILGIGPLAIGDVKYKTEAGLFQRLAASSTPSRSISVTPSLSHVKSLKPGATFLIAVPLSELLRSPRNVPASDRWFPIWLQTRAGRCRAKSSNLNR